MHLCPWNKEGWNQQASSQQANLAFRWVLKEIRVEQATLWKPAQENTSKSHWRNQKHECHELSLG